MAYPPSFRGKTGTVKVDNSVFFASGFLRFQGGALHRVIREESGIPIFANAGSVSGAMRRHELTITSTPCSIAILLP